jgi:hypothetical protein
MNPYLVSIRRFLGEEVMGFLALCAFTCALVPLFFPTGPVVSAWLSAVQWVAVGLFLIEYVTGFFWPNRRRHISPSLSDCSSQRLS